MRRSTLAAAATLGSALVLLIVGGSASGWTLPPSFPQTPLSDHAANDLPLPPGAERPPVADHCVRFPDPANCRHPQAAPADARAGSAPRLVHCGDRAAASDASTELRSCDRKGKGYVLIFGK
jgi:hypothetical protein